MKLLIKEKMFSLFDSFKVYNEEGDTVYKVNGKLALKHSFEVENAKGEVVASLKEKLISLLPEYRVTIHGKDMGAVEKKLTLIHPKFTFTGKGWTASGDIFEWDYEIKDKNHKKVATISKKLLHLTDTYMIDTVRDEDALACLMFVLAIDADKCTREQIAEN